MTRWPAVATTTGLMVVALAGFNVRLYRRMKAASAVAKARGEASDTVVDTVIRDFVADGKQARR